MEARSYNTVPMGRSTDLLAKNEDANCWGRRSRIEQILIVICCIFSIAVIGLVIGLVVVLNEEDETTTQPPVTDVTTLAPLLEECTTEACKRAASVLKVSINNSINPCEDFYSYVCSGWKNSNSIPAKKSVYSMFSLAGDKLKNDLKTALPKANFQKEDARTKAKILYESCINNKTRELKGDKGLKDVLDKLGGWPLLGKPLKQNYNWMDALAYSLTELLLGPILVVWVGVDAKNTSRYVIQLDQTTLGIGRKILVSKNETNNRTEEMMTAYRNFIKKSAFLLGTTKSEKELDDDIGSMIEFEKILALNTRTPEERRDPNSMYGKITVSELNIFLEGKIVLLPLLTKIFSNITNVTGNTDVIVKEFSYLYEISKVLSGVKPEVVANYIGWSAVRNYGSAATQEFRDAKLEFDKIVVGVQESTPLDEECVSRTNDILSFATGSVFINSGFHSETKTEIEDMIVKMKEAFRELLRKNTWMSEESRELAEHKLNEMIPMVAFPPWINDTDQLNDYYKELDDMKEDDFFENVMSALKFMGQKQLKKINELHNRTEEWITSPAIVNAFYSPDSNTITFPAGILQPPFYQVGLPAALNFASIGSVIGHEMTHGFDDEGSQYDAEGNLKSWWPREVRQRFKNQSQCFVKQYGKCIEPATKMELNGLNTLGENIADNGGIREAFEAYKLHVSKTGHNLKLPDLDLTSDQLFFVSYSYIWCSNERTQYLEQSIQYNEHSPSRFRVQIPCSNFAEFSRTFNCPAGSTMNPENRCLLW